MSRNTSRVTRRATSKQTAQQSQVQTPQTQQAASNLDTQAPRNQRTRVSTQETPQNPEIAQTPGNQRASQATAQRTTQNSDIVQSTRNQRAAPQRTPQNPDNTQVPRLPQGSAVPDSTPSQQAPLPSTSARAASIADFVNRTDPEMLYRIVDYIESEFPQEMRGITKTTNFLSAKKLIFDAYRHQFTMDFKEVQALMVRDFSHFIPSKFRAIKRAVTSQLRKERHRWNREGQASILHYYGLLTVDKRDYRVHDIVPAFSGDKDAEMESRRLNTVSIIIATVVTGGIPPTTHETARIKALLEHWFEHDCFPVVELL